MQNLDALRDRLSDILDAQSAATGVAGAVVGVAVGDEQFSLSHGLANLNAGQEFTPDTGWLLGSVTKMLTTTLLLRMVDAGAIELDRPVHRYLPDFTLTDTDAAARITVRMLVNHTNGMDADSLMPSDVRGRDASRSYLSQLARRGTVFEPGAGIHYSNPGFVVAARIIEEQTGSPFERVIQSELFDPCGMNDATAVQTQAFLRRTAIGSFSGTEPGTLQSTTLFSLPESAAGAGGTPIVTTADMIAFGRMHLAGGLAPNGRRVLSPSLVAAMQTPTASEDVPHVPPIGLGWWLPAIAGTTAAWHGGGSPGGRSSFCILPEYDAVVVSYVSGPNALLNDTMHTAVIEHLTGRRATPPFTPASATPDPDVAGSYSSFQLEVDAETDELRLMLRTSILPYDAEHRRILAAYGNPPETPVPHTAVAPGLYAPEGMEPDLLAGFFGRAALIASRPAAPGRPAGLQMGTRFVPKTG
ncbi:serine hydrolase domain-containing protein [Rhodococcus wratislaviensis]|uniref:Putative penicillin-binding protein n=1 Tax=Rhodococcus wratislaviensis NBRC 100605 TaxID=1219028 RepID=X0PW87_RHOWR|nr:serine hydrolase domain-containing protein [Rhodococcus wratislaviensis]GAF47533.1 putative penicillin-binding protein [Rhodococcus wratislaviensis NBRC 100605]